MKVDFICCTIVHLTIRLLCSYTHIFLVDSSDATMSENCGRTDAAFVSSLDQVIQEGNQLVQEGEDILNSVRDDEETAHNKKQKISKD
jgi:hypothetical protein